jgi:thioredoxin reductase (NADPH)
MADRVMANPKVEVIWDSELADVLGDQTVNAIKIRNLKTNAVTEMKMDGVFIAIGHKPNTTFLAGQVTTDPTGYVITEGKSTYTSVPGVFAAGDVQDSNYRQAITAAGTGCMAAMDAERWLDEHDD